MDLWNDDEPIGDRFEEHGIEVPEWIDDDITPADVAAIVQGGCDSGAYMPAVTYHQALETMGEHGDEVLDYLEGNYGELPKPPSDISWSGLACFYLSAAVESWAHCVAGALEEMDDEDEAA